MMTIEIHVRLTSHDGKFDDAKKLADAILAAAKQSGDRTVRCDWFAHDRKKECVAMIVHADEAAMRAHQEVAGEYYRSLSASCEAAFDVFGRPDAEALAAISKFNLRVFNFADGLTRGPAVRASTNQIEIYTGFSIQPGKLSLFKRLAAELTHVVRKKDTGTLRYDWFYDDEHRACVSLDTYADAGAMFAHMKNCHDAHDKLLEHALMTTEFLGELPEEAMRAVARYDPYILQFYRGLQPHSSGGIV